jgi:hypothetical protein
VLIIKIISPGGESDLIRCGENGIDAGPDFLTWLRQVQDYHQSATDRNVTLADAEEKTAFIV